MQEFFRGNLETATPGNGRSQERIGTIRVKPRRIPVQNRERSRQSTHESAELFPNIGVITVLSRARII
jgi:hypothetical protein